MLFKSFSSHDMILKAIILLLGIIILLDKKHLHAAVSTCNNKISVEFYFTLHHQCTYKSIHVTLINQKFFVFKPFNHNSKSAIEIPLLYHGNRK